MSSDRFEATFVVRVDRNTAWDRLTRNTIGDSGRTEQPRAYWLPGFDSSATLTGEERGTQLRLAKDEEPCAGTEILITLEDAETGTRITVVQSGFGDWFRAAYDLMEVGWRHIVADLETYLSTGVHAARHLRPWGDFGAALTPSAGGLRVDAIRTGTLADRLTLQPDDVVVVLSGAPVSTHDDLATVLRVLAQRPGEVEAEWVRDGELMTAATTSP